MLQQKLGLNIDDISQTVLDEYFTMMAVVSSDEKKDFTQLRSELEGIRVSLCMLEINIQSAAILISCTICRIGVERYGH